MKKLLVLLFVLCSMSAFAQDVIVKKDGSTVVCRVVEVTASSVTYKLWSDLNGSSFIIDKTLVSAINYENGKKETFSETENKYLPGNQNDGVQAMNDQALLDLDAALNKKFVDPKVKRLKRLKIWGWIGGGVLVAGGIAIIAISASDQGFQGEIESPGLIAAGAGCAVLGAGLTTTCLVLANKQKKKIEAPLQSSAIYRYDIPFSNGSSLSVGADMLNDCIMNKRTVGLGLSYNF